MKFSKFSPQTPSSDSQGNDQLSSLMETPAGFANDKNQDTPSASNSSANSESIEQECKQSSLDTIKSNEKEAMIQNEIQI